MASMYTDSSVNGSPVDCLKFDSTVTSPNSIFVQPEPNGGNIQAVLNNIPASSEFNYVSYYCTQGPADAAVMNASNQGYFVTVF
jgi:hypothetical protein